MTALLLVDLQNDFFPGGALGVALAPEILPTVEALQKLPFDLIIATQDWHPPNHKSFAERHHLPVGTVIDLHGVQQVLWPVHCVQGSPGAEFAGGWDTKHLDTVIHKGTDPNVDSYSAFFDNEANSSTGLELYLKRHEIHTIVIAGLATDYCVKYSALDALKLGFKTVVVPEGCRGVNLDPNDSRKALEEIAAAGATLATVEQVKSTITSKTSSVEES